jgi:hypothetical protein
MTDSDDMGIVCGGGWIKRRVQRRLKTRIAVMCALSLTGGSAVTGVLAWLGLADVLPLVPWFVLVPFWTILGLTAVAWIAVLAVRSVEKPREVEVLIDNPNVDEQNLH